MLIFYIVQYPLKFIWTNPFNTTHYLASFFLGQIWNLIYRI